MKLSGLFRVGVVMLVGGTSLVYSPCALADWAVSTDPMMVRVAPAAGASMRQNPPGFAWSRYEKKATGYELSIRDASGKTYRWQAERNWFLPSSPLSAGTYSWRVRALADNAPWSEERRFSIPADATLFVVPDDAQLIARLKKKGHPRALPVEDGEDTWRKKIMAARSSSVARLESQVRSTIRTPPLTEAEIVFVPKERNASAWATSVATIQRQMEVECLQLRASALLWRLTHEHDMLNEALRRGAALASYDPNGATGHRNQDQASRNIAWSLALALDYLAGDLPPKERAAWLASIEARTQAIHDDLVNSGWRLEQMPFDSHGSVTFGYLAAISTLLVGDIPQGEKWFRDSFRSFAQHINPWGGEEGGFANGTAYAEYATDTTVQLWDRMWVATGVNFYEKPWSKGLLRFFIDFLPPGTSVHQFGDAAESKPGMHQIKAYANRFADPEAAWYVANLPAQENAYSLLGAPVPLPVEQVRAAPPRRNSDYFPSIGWVAMHSSVTDPQRTSLYFKSSQFGSFNHSHGDQNSFTVSVSGTPLLLDTGYYDWYGSPHWLQWYRQTAAHNAITFDGGKGQVVDGYEEPMRAGGKMVFFRPAPQVDMAEGDATPAYGGMLSKALRRIWYLRDLDMIVVWDRLQAPQAHIFEWNFHAPAPIEQTGAGRLAIRHQDKAVCVRSVLPSQTRFEQSSGYMVAPRIDNPAPVWHGRIAAPSPQKAMEFLHVISVGCREDAGQVKIELKQRVLTVGGHALHLS